MNYAHAYIAISRTRVEGDHPLVVVSEVVPRNELKIGTRTIILTNCRVAGSPSTCPYWIDEEDLFEAEPGLTP